MLSCAGSSSLSWEHSCYLGCKKTSPLVGSWESTETIGKQPAKIQLSFAEDGTYTNVTTISQGKMVVTDRGHWSQPNENSLTTKVDDVDWKFSGNLQLVARAEVRFKQNKQKIIDSTNQHPTEKIAWSGSQSFTITSDDGSTRTYQRAP